MAECGGCVRGGYRLVQLPNGQFCMAYCSDEPTPPPVPAVDIEPDANDPSGMTVDLTVTDNPGGGPVLVDWGDGTPVEQVDVGQQVQHVYAEPGTYVVTVTSADDPGVTTSTSVTVPYVARRTWTDVKDEWASWGDIDVPTWNDLLTFTPQP